MSQNPQLSLFGASRPEAEAAAHAQTPSLPAPAPPVPIPAQPPSAQEAAPTAALALPGLDGTNPLGMLAALGLLRLADELHPGRARLRWAQGAGWHAVLEAPISLTASVEVLSAALLSQLRALRAHPVVQLRWTQLKDGNEPEDDEDEEAQAEAPEAQAPKGHKLQQNLRMPPGLFAELITAAVEGDPAPGLSQRAALDVVAGYAAQGVEISAGKASEWWTPEGGLRSASPERLRGSELMFTTGQQQFLKYVIQLIDAVDGAALQEALVGPWQRGGTTDPDRRAKPPPAFGWDAADSRDHALRGWDPTNKKRSPRIGTPGADLLAFWAVSMLPVFPARGGRGTEGRMPAMRWHAKSGSLTWGLWQRPLSIDGARAALNQADLWELSNEVARQRGFAVRVRSGVREIGNGGQRVFTPPVFR